MRDLKYIIVHPKNTDPLVWAVAILFNGIKSHGAVVPEGYICVSGGYCTVGHHKVAGVKVKITGRAASLSLDSREEDAKIIEHTLNRTNLFM